MVNYLQQDPDLEWVMVDATIIRAPVCAAGCGKKFQTKEAFGRSKGGFTTKIHALTGSLEYKDEVLFQLVI